MQYPSPFSDLSYANRTWTPFAAIVGGTNLSYGPSSGRLAGINCRSAAIARR